MDYTEIIKEIGRGAKGARDLDRTQANRLFEAILDGKIPDLELGAIVLGMRVKTESPDELLGFKDALDARTPQLMLPAGAKRCVIIPSYAGARRQPNLTPLLALLLAREGLPVLVHGRHDFESRADPGQLMERLDIPRADSVAEMESLLASRGIAFIELETLVPGLDALLALRLRLGVRNSGHTMAKLLDPCRGRSLRLVAVTHPEYFDKMRAFLLADGGRALLMRATEGESYANPRRRPQMECFINGRSEIVFEAETGGAPPLDYLPETTDIAANAELIRSMLEGATPIPQPILDQLACCLYCAGAAGRP